MDENANSYDEVQLKAGQWAFEHYLAQGKEVTRQIMVATAVYLIVTVLAVFVNLGTIEAVSVEAGGVTANLASSWPVRLVLLFASTLMLAALTFLSVFFTRYGMAVEYFAKRGLPRAQEAVNFELWLAHNHARLNAANAFAGVAVLSIAVILYAAVIVTFVVSLF